ncbi:MAG: GNVR domain-containing protein [Polyangiales bacterium]
MGVTLLSGMEFQSSGRLYLGELDGKKQQQINPQDFLLVSQGDVYSEIEIIRSRSRVQQAVMASGLNVKITRVGQASPSYWRWLLAKRDPALLDQTIREITAHHASPVSRAQEPVSFKVKFGKHGRYVAYTKEGVRLGEGQLGTPTELPSVRILLAAGTEKSPSPGDRYELKVRPVEEAVDDALRSLQVTAAKVPTAVEPVKVLNLEFNHYSPYKSAAFLQHLMEVYLFERQSWKIEDANAAELFVTKQLESMQRLLGASEEKLADFRAANPMVVQQKQGETVVEQLGDYEEQRTAARLAVAGLRVIQQALQQPKPSIEQYMMGEAQDNVLLSMAGGLMEAQRKLAESESHLYEGAPAVIQQRGIVDNQLQMVRRYVSSRLERAEEQVRSLDHVIEQSREKLQSVPGAELGLARIGRESEVYSRVYSYLLERQQQTQILRASTVSKNRIIDLPQVPVREHSPKLLLRGASGLLGLLLGAIVVVLQSLATTALRTEAELRGALGDTAMFASLPNYKRNLRRTGRTEQAPVFDLFARSDRVGLAESFRTLRTNLYYALPPGRGKIILLSSPSSGDGKTVSTLCLATILAADRKRVLVIDADLRKPTHHLMTNRPPEPGLRDLLNGRADGEVIHTVHVTCGSFDAISAGLGAPAELLSTPRFGELLHRLRNDYDYLLLDSASYPLVSDALVLARLSDFVLSVIRLGSTPRKLAEEHVRDLGMKSNGHAVVINDSDANTVYGHPAFALQQQAAETQWALHDDDADQSDIRIQ